MLGILCGLDTEAKIAESFKALIACSGAAPQQARILTRGLVEQGATRLMSFGVAGALDTGLPVGAVIVGSKVVSHKGAWMCDPTWMDELLHALPMAQHGAVWGSEFLVPTAEEKIALGKDSGCAIVDMESQCAAEIADELGLPLAVVRVVCDTASHTLPALTMACIKTDGKINWPKAVIGGLLHPGQIPDMCRTGHSMRRALKVLEKSAALINA